MSVATLPTIELFLGQYRACLLLCVGCGAAGFLGFLPLWGVMGTVGVLIHVGLAVAVLAGLELGKSNVKSFAPLFVAKGQQGKGFGYVATVLRLGEILAGFVAMELYEKYGSALSSVAASTALLFFGVGLLTALVPNNFNSASTSTAGLRSNPMDETAS